MTTPKPLKSTIQTESFSGNKILKVVDSSGFVENGYFGEDYCLLLNSEDTCLDNLLELTWGGVLCPNILRGQINHLGLSIFYNDENDIVSNGDVISIFKNRLEVLYRKGSNSNMLFVTERCNHNCIMCSQPPRNNDDSWRIEENHRLIDLIDSDEMALGISGGEPTILGGELIRLIEHCKERLPNTLLHILSNGTKLSSIDFVRQLSSANHRNILWGIPIYGSTPSQHDYHTQRVGSFNETLHGLYNLALFNQMIELRVLLTSNVLKEIRSIADFIVRNLPFVSTVAFMGVEPTGYAKLNHKLVISEFDCHMNDISYAIKRLKFSSINPALYNVPLCKVPHELRDFSVKSISDWKNFFYSECSSCIEKDNCCGFFVSQRKKFHSKNIVPITEVI